MVRLVKIMRFNALVRVEDGDDVDEMMDKLFDAVDNLCGDDLGEGHDCRLLVAGGRVQSEEDFEEEERWADYADEMRRLKKKLTPKRRRAPR